VFRHLPLGKVSREEMNREKLNTDVHPEFSDRLYSPHTAWTKPSLNWMKLPARYSFDLEQARFEFEKIRQRFPLKPFEVLSKEGKSRPRLSYRGLGLTARSRAAEPLYDALSLYAPGDRKLSIYHTFEKVSDRKSGGDRVIEVLDEKGFDQETEACSPYFKELISRFRSPTTKVRFLEMLPGGYIPPHVDFPFYNGIRVHACLYSNTDVTWEVEGEQFSIPCDGNFYWFDTGRYHAVRNAGKESRIVFSVNLSPYFHRDGTARLMPDVDLMRLIRSGDV
jgi:hypothetical protein